MNKETKTICKCGRLKMFHHQNLSGTAECRRCVNGSIFHGFEEGKNPAAVALGSIKSKKKAKASRENGKLGGHPPSNPKKP